MRFLVELRKLQRSVNPTSFQLERDKGGLHDISLPSFFVVVYNTTCITCAIMPNTVEPR